MGCCCDEGVERFERRSGGDVAATVLHTPAFSIQSHGVCRLNGQSPAIDFGEVPSEKQCLSHVGRLIFGVGIEINQVA